jgi:hypothetical protein
MMLVLIEGLMELAAVVDGEVNREVSWPLTVLALAVAAILLLFRV